ncbi:MAG: DUF1018 domain-containing protein [Spirochaetales bacterium]|nr:DUF1018 domain-containing protein [Spirochaetales bacterium]
MKKSGKTTQDHIRELQRRRRASASGQPALGRISKDDIRRVWGLAKKLGFDEGMLYTILFEQTGSESLSRISARSGKQLVAHLAHLLEPQERSERRQNRRDGIEQLAHWKRTPAQDALIVDLLGRINGATVRINVESICNRMFKKPLAELNRRQAQSIIEALKSIANRDPA